MPNPIEQHAAEFASAIEHLEGELKGLRSGRASAGMVETISVFAYGSTMELKGVASISIPDPKTIQIEPWDKALTKEIEKALTEADLGMQPNTMGSTIRLSLPPMNEENRKRLVKQAHELGEDARIAVRNIRGRIRDEIQSQKEIGEDEQQRLLEELDKRTKELNVSIEAILKQKEEEIMTV
ncbi:MAG: ribosome recycling factor [Candidatus Parcubacteria bacterium]|jgi:ribosome recycling factor